MTACDLARLDGDLTYSPYTMRIRDTFFWRAPRPAIAAGYAFKQLRLPGKAGDGLDMKRAAKARELTREVLRFLDGTTIDKVSVKHGTWGWLIASYLHDDLSPFQDVKGSTQEQYRSQARYWTDTIGDSRIEDMDLRLIKGIEKAMKANGKSPDFVSKNFSGLRRMVRYGEQIKAPGARDVASVLGATRFASVKPREVNPSGAQVMAVVAAADQAGDDRFALALLLQWWLCLRPMDVRGDFIPMKPGEGGGITEGKRQWRNGLTWAMIRADLTEIRKVISKTERSDARAAVLDLTALDDVRARLAAIPVEERVGPVITQNGRPYDKKRYGVAWRKYAKAAGVPDEVQCRDLRAGSINDAVAHGATKLDVQHAARHSNAETTERYIRGRDATANKVVQMRAGTSAQRP